MIEIGAHNPGIVGELESGEAGSYSPNRAFIRLSKKSAFWKDDVNPSPKDQAVFLHEYIHYLHNFSTSAGISDFIYELRASQYFLRTVGADGSSAGLSDLQEVEQREYTETQRLRGKLRGDFNLPPHATIHQRNVKLSYVSHVLTEATFRFPSQDVKVGLAQLTLLVSSASSENSIVEVNFGTMLLTEGVAFELECLYLERLGHDIKAHRDDVKPMPYMVVRAILEGMTGKAVSSEICIKVCLLALQATDAGAHFFEIIGRIRDSSTDMGSEVARLAGESQRAIEGELQRFEKAISDATALFASRNMIGPAVGHFKRTAVAYFTERTKNIFFELEVVKFDSEYRELYEFLARFPPCMIQVQDPASSDPDPLEFVIAMKAAPAFVESLAAYHSMMHFGLAHFAQNLVGTDLLKPKKCPFFSSCSLPLKLSRPDICEMKPWESFDPHSQTSCWYASGVAVARARPNRGLASRT